MPLPPGNRFALDEARRAGLESVLRRERFAIVATEGKKVELAILIGEGGTLTLECESESCLGDMDSLVATMDFRRLDEFAGFNHRKAAPRDRK